MARWLFRTLCCVCLPNLLANASVATDERLSREPPPLVGPNLDVHDPTPFYVRAMLAARAESGGKAKTATLPGTDVELGGWAEPTIAVNPTDPLNIAYASLGELRVSTDGGLTWRDPVAPVLPTDYAPGGDPSLAFDASGRLFFGYLAFPLGPRQSFLGIDMFIAQCDPTTGAFLPDYPVNVTTQLGVPGSAGNVTTRNGLRPTRIPTVRSSTGSISCGRSSRRRGTRSPSAAGRRTTG